MRLLSTILFLTISISSFAQHSTLRFQDEPFMLDQQSVLVVPFESKMYLSDVNAKLAEKNQMNSEEIVKRFTNALDQSLYYTFRDRCKVTSFYSLEDDSSDADLSYIYRNTELDYELVSSTQEKKGTFQKVKSKVKKQDPKEGRYDRGGIQNGEIVTKRDPRERYMKAVIKDQKMLDSMHFKFNNRFFLFLNQLDFKNVYEDGVSMQRMEYNRELKVHFTLYQKDGTILTTGISKTLVPGTENDIDVITAEYFPILAKNIFNALFEIEEEDKSESKLKLPWK